MAHIGFFQAKPPAAAPKLADQKTRDRLTGSAIKAVTRIAERWRLTVPQAAQLLGVAERTWYRIKRNEWAGALSQDEMTRASAMIGIFKGLHLLFSDPLADEWVALPNNQASFDGRSPLDLMINGGIPAMLVVRRHIDALRGGL